MAPRVALMRRRVRRLLRRAGAAPTLPAPVRLLHAWAGRGYAWPTDEARDAVAAARSAHGLALETTYTGKTLAALRGWVRFHGLERRTHLFVDTFDPR